MARTLLRRIPPGGFVSKRSLQRIGFMLVLIGLLFLAAMIVIGFVERAWQEHQLNRAIEQQRAENNAQKARNLQLAGQADWAESDVAAELAARERLGMAREGETVLLPTVVLPPMPTPVAVAPPPVAPPPGEEVEFVTTTNVERWFNALFPDPDAEP